MNTPMRILALDLATKTGWALQANDRKESGVQDFSVERGESAGMRFVKFNRWLNAIAMESVATTPAGQTIRCPAVDLIVYEMPHLRGGAAAEVLSGFSTRVHEFCALNNVNHQSVHSQSLKKFITGKGNASKEDVMRVVRAFDNTLSIIDDNHADALALLAYARHHYEPVP